MIYSNDYNDAEKEILEKLKKARLNDFDFSGKDISVNDLKEMREWIEDRWETEWAIAELHNTCPPEDWLKESREIMLQICTELANRLNALPN